MRARGRSWETKVQKGLRSREVEEKAGGHNHLGRF